MEATMNRKTPAFLICLFLLVVACQPVETAPAQVSQPAATDAPSTDTPAPIEETDPPAATEAQPTATQVPTPAATASVEEVAELYPLAKPGPYFPGKRTYQFIDESRGGRAVDITVWYPAIKPEGYAGTIASEAEPDLSGAPYPLIINSTKNGNVFAAHLVSHGFVVAGVNTQDSSDRWDLWLVDFPLDQLFMLEQIAAQPLKHLEGVVDAENAGAMGYSFDAYDALAMSGARVDPQFYQEQCASASSMTPVPPEWWIHYICDIGERWDELAGRAGMAITTSEDGLWQPMTNPRLKAILSMAPEGAWLFGERGMAAVDRPVLYFGAAEDQLNYYDLEAALLFERTGTPQKSLITFVGRDHMMFMNFPDLMRMQHFAAAFFGHILQGREDYAQYYSEEFVQQHPELAWGVFQENP
jgi:predicted dienelactone hydrolase